MGNAPTPDTPLSGLRIMVTRPEDPDDPLAEQLRRLGAEIVAQPAIRIAPPDDWRLVDEVLDRLDRFDWIVFSSANGVRYWFDRMDDRRRTMPETCRTAAIGPGTADELLDHDVQVDLVPEPYRAEALAAALADRADGRRFLLVRASRGREVLAERLAAAGAVVEQVVVYTSADVERPDPAVAALLHAGRIDWITVTSSSIARSLIKMFGDGLRLAKLASISPITSASLREQSFEPAVEAAEYTVAGLAKAIVAVRDT